MRAHRMIDETDQGPFWLALIGLNLTCEAAVVIIAIVVALA